MSVLLEALSRANARKDALWDGRVVHLTGEEMMRLHSDSHLDPADVSGYMDTTVAAFAMELVEDRATLEAVFYGLLAEGLLMGEMIRDVAHEQIARGHRKPPEPTIIEAATRLWSLVWERLNVLGLAGDKR